MSNATTRTIGRYTYVLADGRAVAIMERSPWTGEFCYGLAYPADGAWSPRPLNYRPPFTPTRRKSATAAARVVLAALASN